MKDLREEVTVRQAKDADLPVLAEMEAHCFSVPWSKQSLGERLSSPYAYVTVAERGGMPLGFLCGTVLVPECEIERVAVLPEARRCGIGTALLSRAVQDMREMGGETVLLEVRASNLPAQALYFQAGFTACGVRRHYYRQPTEDAVVLRKGLSPVC